MMKKLIVTIVLIIVAVNCGKNKPENRYSPAEEIQIRADNILEKIKENPYSFMSRCDRLTFASLLYQVWQFDDIWNFEYPAGKWNRDIEPCYPKASRSEISPEGIIGVSRILKTANDFDALSRFLDYANESKWTLGAGPNEYTYMPHLAHLFYEMASGEPIQERSDPLEKVKQYKWMIIVDYIETKGNIYGSISDIELELLKVMHKKYSDNPIPMALLLKYDYDDGIESKFNEVMNDFPLDDIPGYSEVFGWNKAPARILYVWLVKGVLGK